MEQIVKSITLLSFLYALSFSAEWSPNGVCYSVNDEVTYNSRTYQCVYSHTSQIDWYPGASGLWFWEELEESNCLPVPDWELQTWYSAGDEVTYANEWYICTFNHTSQVDWYPGAPGLWFWQRIADSDNDGVPDRIELIAGTDRYDNTSKPAVIKNSSWVNKTCVQKQKVMLDYSHYPNYNTCDDIEVTFNQLSISGDNLPPVQLVPEADLPSLPLPPGFYSADAAYQQVCCATIRSGETVEFPFVISDGMQDFPGTALKLYHYDSYSSDWNEIPVSRIENKAIYANIEEKGYYVVASYQNVITVNPDKPVVVGSNYQDLSPAMQYLISKHITDGNAANRFEIHVAARASAYVCDGQFIPANALIQGGYNFSRSNMPDAAINPTFIKPGSTTKAAFIGGNAGYFFTDAVNKYTDFNNTIIDGFQFDGKDNPTTVTATAGAVFICGAWHVRDIRFRNCVFTENKGTMAGAVFVNNGSLIFFDNCAFTGNVSTAGGELEAPVCNNVICRDDLVMDNFSGGAATVFEFDGCGSEVEFHSCVFYNNNTTFTGYTGASPKLGGTVAIYGGAGAGRPVKIVNSTFTKNTVAADAASGSAKSVYNGNFEAMTGTPVVLMNNILYGNNGPAVEVAGITEANVSYKTNIRAVYLPEPPAANDYSVAGISYCNIQGFAGSDPSNINNDPEFIDDLPASVKGEDGSWLTADDGLNVKMSSQVRKSAKYNVLPEQIVSTETDYYRKDGFFDAASRLRQGFEVSASTFRTDMGAYEKYVKVMCIGDQNTEGHTVKETRAFISYRNHLKDFAKASNIEIEFVGSKEDEHGKHEGYANQKVEYFYNTYDVATAVEDEKTEVIFIMLGTENIRETPTAIVGKLYSSANKSLISEITSKTGVAPKIFVGTIPEIREKHDQVKSLNDEIEKPSPWNTITTHEVKSFKIDPLGDFYDDAATGDAKWPYNYNIKLLTDSGYSIVAKSFSSELEACY